jgi:hypothetical protein
MLNSSKGELDGKPLSDRVADWLAQQGYPLELQVAHQFRRAGARVFQSEYYIDPDSKSAREIDVHASFTVESPDYTIFRVAFMVECKVSRDKPWVLFTSTGSSLAAPATVAQRPASRVGSGFLRRMAHNPAVQTLGLFALPDAPAYGLTQAFTSGADVAYSAVLAASKAAAALKSEYDSADVNACVVIFPLVVIDGRLFECGLDTEHGDVNVREVQRSTLVWRNRVVGEPHTIVSVLTLSSLADYLVDARSAAQELLRRMQKDKELAQAAVQRSRPPILPHL